MFVFGIKSLQETRVNLPKARMARAILRARTSEIRQGKAGRKVFIFFFKDLFPRPQRGSGRRGSGFISRTIAPLAAFRAAQAACPAVPAPRSHRLSCPAGRPPHQRPCLAGPRRRLRPRPTAAPARPPAPCPRRPRRAAAAVSSPQSGLRCLQAGGRQPGARPRSPDAHGPRPGALHPRPPAGRPASRLLPGSGPLQPVCSSSAPGQPRSLLRLLHSR